MFPVQIFLPSDQFQLVSTQMEGSTLLLTAAPTTKTASCPVCQTPTARIHSHYTRTVQDLASAGYQVVLSLHVRRFVCAATTCPRNIFCERLGNVLPHFARRTARLTQLLSTLAIHVGGQTGARLAHVLRVPTSPRTMLRLIHAHPDPALPPPRVVGLDDWAWKKGATYGTMCVDLERRQPIDLLPDRSAEQVTAWLRAHPSVEVIDRDRGAVYIEGATQGAPQAIQVADRWHLLVRRFTRRLISVRDGKGPKDCLWVNQLTLRRKPRGTRACW